MVRGESDVKVLRGTVLSAALADDRQNTDGDVTGVTPQPLTGALHHITAEWR